MRPSAEPGSCRRSSPNVCRWRKAQMRMPQALISTAVLLLVLGATPISAIQTSQDVGKAPPIPEAGWLGMPRSLKQVGLPIAATRATIPADNPQTPEKIELGKKLFFDGRLSA